MSRVSERIERNDAMWAKQGEMLITVVGGIVYNMLFAVDVECRV